LEQRLADDGFDIIMERFPKYSGEKTKEGYLKFLENEYFKLIPDHINPDYVSTFPCCGLDTGLMGNLFLEAKNHILQRAIARINMH
jgi:hypothetical protein